MGKKILYIITVAVALVFFANCCGSKILPVGQVATTISAYEAAIHHAAFPGVDLDAKAPHHVTHLVRIKAWDNFSALPATTVFNFCYRTVYLQTPLRLYHGNFLHSCDHRSSVLRGPPAVA
jgi:hypothetical protein